MSRLESRKEVELRRPIRIAFVKNATYRDLYFKVGHFDEETIFSSEGRSGPVGLIEGEFDATYLIVYNSDDLECQVYQREHRDKMAGSFLVHYDSQISRMQDVAVAAEEVDWGQFDLVWAFETAIPARITRQFPSVVWATMLENHMHPKFLNYIRQPPIGYDLVFTQAFGRNPRSLIYGKHVIDWPYALTKHNTILNLFPNVQKQAKLFMSEVHQDTERIRQCAAGSGFSLPDQRRSNVRLNFKEFQQMLVESTYYISTNSARSLWGNALPEAGSAGCLVLANPSQNWNSYTIAPKARAYNVEQALGLMYRLDRSASLLADLKRQQDALIDWHCFYRPISTMIHAVKSLDRYRELQIATVDE